MEQVHRLARVARNICKSAAQLGEEWNSGRVCRLLLLLSSSLLLSLSLWEVRQSVARTRVSVAESCERSGAERGNYNRCRHACIHSLTAVQCRVVQCGNVRPVHSVTHCVAVCVCQKSLLTDPFYDSLSLSRPDIMIRPPSSVSLPLSAYTCLAVATPCLKNDRFVLTGLYTIHFYAPKSIIAKYKKMTLSKT